MAAPAMQQSWVQSLGGEDPLEKGMATHSSIHAWRIPWTEEPGGLQYMVSQKSDMTEQLMLSLSKDLIEIGNHECEQPNLIFPVISYV